VPPHTAPCRLGCRHNCHQSFQWIKPARLASRAEGIPTPDLSHTEAKVTRERLLLTRVVAPLPEDSQSIGSGGNQIRTGDTMIFSHMQKPLGMRYIRIGKRFSVQGVQLDTSWLCPYCCATVDTAFVTPTGQISVAPYLPRLPRKPPRPDTPYEHAGAAH
jgi:hypothetical protein